MEFPLPIFLQDCSSLTTRNADSLMCINQWLSYTTTAVSNQRVVYGKQGQREQHALAVLRLYAQSFIPSVLYFYGKVSWAITIFFIIICSTKYCSTQCQMANIQNKNNARPILERLNENVTACIHPTFLMHIVKILADLKSGFPI